MSHIDETRLHEYLDVLERGQDRGGRAAGRQGDRALEWDQLERHVAECGECRARLDDVRAIRGRASALLNEAAPVHIAMPPFEEIEARARVRTRPAPRRVFTMNRLTALGWAATIALAVGIGWIARGSFEFRQTDEDLPVATGASEPTSVLDEVASVDEAVAPSTATERFQVQVPAAIGGRGAEAAPRDIEPLPSEPARAEAPPPAPELRVAEEGAAEREQLAKAAPTDLRQAVGDTAPRQERRRDAPAAGLAAEVQEADVVGRLLNEAAGETAWRDASATEAATHLGDSLRTISGLPVDSIAIGEVDGAPAARVVQILPSGDRLEIVQWQTANAENEVANRRAAFADRPLETRSSVGTQVVTRNGIVLVLSASLAADSLQALADRIP
jgi:hypothetical protein